MSLVIGEISYTNILPLYYYLDRELLVNHGCSFTPQVPSELNASMKAGRVDVGGISSFAYAENVSQFTLLPDLSVSAYEKVGSIFLFSKVPIEQLSGKSIALTSSSATSVHLLKVILERFYQLEVKYETMKPSMNQMLEQHDACLLIGDDAILATWGKAENLYQYDLASLWYKHTGLPMTFAVVAVRNAVIGQKSHLVGMLYRSFIQSKMLSKSKQFQPMIKDILQTYGGEKSFWDEYFQELCYEFSETEQKGLALYYQFAYDLGYLPKPVDAIHIWKTVES